MDLFGSESGERLWNDALPLEDDDPIKAPVSLTVSLWGLCDVLKLDQFKDQLGDGLSEHLMMYLQKKVRVAACHQNHGHGSQHCNCRFLLQDTEDTQITFSQFINAWKNFVPLSTSKRKVRPSSSHAQHNASIDCL